ncbi:MAG: hypothetical protein ACYS6W_15185, partial [Planctomycetota bacterium]
RLGGLFGHDIQRSIGPHEISGHEHDEYGTHTIKRETLRSFSGEDTRNAGGHLFRWDWCGHVLTLSHNKLCVFLLEKYYLSCFGPEIKGSLLKIVVYYTYCCPISKKKSKQDAKIPEVWQNKDVLLRKWADVKNNKYCTLAIENWSSKIHLI